MGTLALPLHPFAKRCQHILGLNQTYGLYTFFHAVNFTTIHCRKQPSDDIPAIYGRYRKVS